MDNERIIALMEAMHRKLMQEIRLVGSKVDSVGAVEVRLGTMEVRIGAVEKRMKFRRADGSAGSASEAARGEHS